MTSIDLILSLTQISAVETLSVVAGYWLLRRRPDIVPGRITVWLHASGRFQSRPADTLGITNSCGQPVAEANVSGDGERLSGTGTTARPGISLATVREFLRNVDVDDSTATFSTTFNVMTVLGALIALAFCRLLFGLVAMF